MSPNSQLIALSDEWAQHRSLSRLERRNSDRHNSILDNEPAPQQEFSLPQADGGLSAWLFLAGCFTVEALIWGENPFHSSFALHMKFEKFLRQSGLF